MGGDLSSNLIKLMEDFAMSKNKDLIKEVTKVEERQFKKRHDLKFVEVSNSSGGSIVLYYITVFLGNELFCVFIRSDDDIRIQYVSPLDKNGRMKEVEGCDDFYAGHNFFLFDYEVALKVFIDYIKNFCVIGEDVDVKKVFVSITEKQVADWRKRERAKILHMDDYGTHNGETYFALKVKYREKIYNITVKHEIGGGDHNDYTLYAMFPFNSPHVKENFIEPFCFFGCFSLTVLKWLTNNIEHRQNRG